MPLLNIMTGFGLKPIGGTSDDPVTKIKIPARVLLFGASDSSSVTTRW